MDPKGLLGLLFLVTALAGCVAGTDDVTDSDLDATEEAVDCEALLEEHEGESEEEHETEEEALPEECAELFEPAPDPLLHLEWTRCEIMAAQAFVPEDIFGPAPSGMQYIYYQNGGSRLLIVTAVGLECDEMVHRNGSESGVRLFVTYVAIEAVAGWEDADVDHYWLVELVAGDDDQLAIYHEIGVESAFQAEIDWQTRLDGDNGLVGQTGYQTPQFGLDLLVEAAPPPMVVSPYQQRFYMPLEDGDFWVGDVEIPAFDQFLGDAKILISPGIAAGAPTPYPGIGIYGNEADEDFTLTLDRLLPDDA